MTQITGNPTRLGYELVDADNHYYEPYDAFTRYLDPAFADRVDQRAGGRQGPGKLYFGDRQFRYMRVIQTDYIGAPGSLRRMLDDMDNQEGFVHKEIIRGWDYPDMMQRDPRIAKMDSQGVRGGLMLGTMMLAAENELHDDVPALYANIRVLQQVARRRVGLQPRRAHRDRADDLAARPGAGHRRAGAGARSWAPARSS